MSYQASTWVAGQCELTAGEKLLLFAIANRVDECGVGFPGRARLAREACCRPETITVNMKKLAERGLITRFERRRENGSRTSDWLVLAPGFADRAPLEDAEPTEYPAAVAAAAKRSGEDSSGEVSGPPQVRKTGGPEQSEEKDLLEAKASRKLSGGDEVAEVWGHYQSERDHGERCALTPERRLVIRQALKVRSVEECKRAITALLGDEWYVSRGLVDLTYALRGGGRSPSPEATIDRLVAKTQNGHANGNGAGVLRGKVWPDGRTWDDLTPREQMHAREALSMGIEPWREDARVSETWTPERAGGIADAGVTADTFLD